MKFVFFVEGYTEKAAIPQLVKRCLEPHLSAQVGVLIVRFDGWSHFYKDIATKARLHLNGPKRDDLIAAVGLLDLYGPTFFPPHLTTADERSQWGVKTIENQVDHPKFRMFFAHHEIEA